MKIKLKIGEEILSGKFKNKKGKIKSFSTDKNGQPTIITQSGKELKLFTFRIAKLMKKK